MICCNSSRKLSIEGVMLCGVRHEDMLCILECNVHCSIYYIGYSALYSTFVMHCTSIYATALLLTVCTVLFSIAIKTHCRAIHNRL